MGGHAMYVHGYAKNNHFPIDFAIFTKALHTDGRTDGRTDRRTDRPTDGHTLLWRCEDASKKPVKRFGTFEFCDPQAQYGGEYRVILV